MTTPIARDPIYRRRRFEAEIIELCVRWYITYDDPALGRSLRAEVRETVESLGTSGEFFLAHGPDVHLRSRRVAD
jgi:hypothetical protein